MEGNIDFTGAFDKIGEMFNSDEGKEQLRGIIDMFSAGGASEEKECEDTGGFDFDPAMFIKLQKIMSATKGRGNGEKERLLMSLKPFLKEERRDKVDNAIKIMNMSKILTVFKEM